MDPEESKMATVQKLSHRTLVCLKWPGPARWWTWKLSYRSLININRASRWPVIWTSPVAEKRRVSVRIQDFIHSSAHASLTNSVVFFSFFPMTMKWPWLWSQAWRNNYKGVNQDPFPFTEILFVFLKTREKRFVSFNGLVFSDAPRSLLLCYQIK